MAQSSFDALVVGRGVIGSAVAWRLAQAGMRVAIFDSHERGQATKAAAGMLAPLAESNSHPELADFGIPSLRMYPDFLAELEEETGTAVPMNGPGILRVALDESEAAELRTSLGRHADGPFPVQFLTGDEARTIEPALDPAIHAAVLSTSEKHVVPVALADALLTALRRRSVAEFSDSITRLRHNDRAWVAEATSTTIEARQVIVAGGAWTPKLLEPLRFNAPITPLKGQLLHMKYRRVAPPAYTIYAHSTYIVPRSPGEVIVGTTEEPEAEFDASTTGEAVAGLRERGARLVPSLAEASLHRGLAGLRPASPDRLPLIGRVPGAQDLFIASGHGRNGILLTPITAKLMRDIILDDVAVPSSVDPARFAKSA